MDYLLDTNILVIYGRSSEVADKIESDHEFFSGEHNLAVSVVTLGELNSLVKQFEYGDKKIKNLEKLVDDVFKIDVAQQKIIDRYGEIDAFSQNRLKGRKGKFSSRNMGKNDLWIAATASVYDMILVTTDKDFEHLEGDFIKLKYIEIKDYKN